METENRIFFEGNPYPKGHKLEKVVWSGHLDPEKGIYFDFDLETEKYYTDDDSTDSSDPESDWTSKGVWGNYHRCRISSNEGILIATDESPLDFNAFAPRLLTADKLPDGVNILPDDWSDDELAFHIYLLGHDTCAEHSINFIERNSDGSFNIDWKGRIALTYGGDYEFNHNFAATLNNIKFSGIYLPADITTVEAVEAFKKFVKNPDHFELEDLNPKSFKREYKLVLKDS